MKAVLVDEDFEGGPPADRVQPARRHAGSLLRDAFRNRWDLRRAPAPQIIRSFVTYGCRTMLRLARQIQWLRILDDSEVMQRAVKADPGLYERWHLPYISQGFSAGARYRLIAAHYAFLLQRFPVRLRDKILKGHDVRIGTLRLRHGEMVHLHVRKPVTRAVGELGLFLLTNDKKVLSSCVVTFGGDEGLLIGSLQGSWPFMGKQPIREFTRGSHGLRPKNLLLSLVRALARFYGVERVRGVSRAGHVLALSGLIKADVDGFWRESGGVPGENGCYELPRYESLRRMGTLPSKRRAARRRREQFRDEACALFLKAFDWRSTVT
ncbi:DUF535 family protein [Dyella subtropica]|uniref:DUF535 family protein n=1 Tax=Dyella subtropica TaxID=2992127 RepID=UPI0022546DDD|nr:DUF535 family protein [Dyella subtropica]